MGAGEAGVIAELYGKALQEDPSHLPSLRAAGRLLGGAGLGRNATLLYEKAVRRGEGMAGEEQGREWREEER